jgi:serine/threonine protein kinase
LDLLKRLLRDNPAARLSIRDALAHPWLKNHKPVYPDVVDVDSKARL